MSGFEADLRAAIIAAPSFGWCEQRLRAHLDRPDSPRKQRWLDRCRDAASSGMTGDGETSLLDWIKAHWPQILQAFLSLAALLLPLLLASEDERSMMHAEVNDTVEQAMASGWQPGDAILDFAIGQAIDRRILPAIRAFLPQAMLALEVLCFPVKFGITDEEIRNGLLHWLKAGQQ